MTELLVVHSVPAADARWVLQTFTPGVTSALFNRPNAMFRLLAGILLTLLASSFILVLATGRRRALALVAAKTAELARQATHDPLTGLANRALILDRAQRADRPPGAPRGAGGGAVHRHRRLQGHQRHDGARGGRRTVRGRSQNACARQSEQRTQSAG